MFSYIFDVLPEWLCHEAEDGEDDESGEDGSQRVGEGEEDGVALAVVVELVVARHRDQPAVRGPQRKENLNFLSDNILISMTSWDESFRKNPMYDRERQI